MIGYILLITTAIIISSIVYQWARTYIPTDPTECPDGVSISVKESRYDCENKELNLTLRNNGRFNIGGYLIHATTSPNQILASEELSQYTGLKIGAVIFIPFGNPMKPNNEIKNVFNLNNTNFSQIYSVEIIPIIHQDETRVNCADARIKEKLSCFIAGEACIPNTCLDLGYSCNTWDDGCGGTLDCGTCGSGFSCDAIGECISSTCTPATDPSFVGVCGTKQCGTAENGTGVNSCGSISCGTCTGGTCNSTGQCVTICGNGIIETGEQCDDNNTANSDGCSSTCQIETGYSCVGEPSSCINEIIIFMSSSTSNGNLGGISGADTTCNNLASSANLGGTFVAWLSNNTLNAKDRIPTGIPFVRTDNTEIAENLADLIDGDIEERIDKDENGDGGGTKDIWTGTTKEGINEGSNCNNWSSSSDSDKGRRGQTDKTNKDWTDDKDEDCEEVMRLYCLQIS